MIEHDNMTIRVQVSMSCPSPPQHTLASLRAGADQRRRQQDRTGDRWDDDNDDDDDDCRGQRGRRPGPLAQLRVPGAAAPVAQHRWVQ